MPILTQSRIDGNDKVGRTGRRLEGGGGRYTGEMLRSTTESALVSRTRRDIRSAWGIALLWNLVSTPLLFIIPREVERNPLVAIAALFPLVGLGLVVYAARLTARWRRFGKATFEVLGPASTGRTLSGHIRFPHSTNLPDGTLATVRLTCLSRTIDRDGDVQERILWREETCTPMASGDGATVAVSIAIPPDALATMAANRGAGICWALAVDAALPGIDLHELFDVHVHPSTAVEAGPNTSPAPPATHSRFAAVTDDHLQEAGIHIEVVDGRTAFRFAAARNPSFAAGLTGFVAVWTGALVLQHTLGIPIVFIAITALVELLLLAVTIDLWLGVTVLAIGAGRIHRRYSILGIPSHKSWPCADVTSIDIAITSQTSGATGTPYYDVRATFTPGRHATLAPRVRDKRQAEWLADRMRELTGLSRPG